MSVNSDLAIEALLRCKRAEFSKSGDGQKILLVFGSHVSAQDAEDLSSGFELAGYEVSVQIEREPLSRPPTIRQEPVIGNGPRNRWGVVS
jgi:hypothetical protein